MKNSTEQCNEISNLTNFEILLATSNNVQIIVKVFHLAE